METYLLNHQIVFINKNSFYLRKVSKNGAVLKKEIVESETFKNIMRILRPIKK